MDSKNSAFSGDTVGRTMELSLDIGEKLAQG
jgi:hypothetical protein